MKVLFILAAGLLVSAQDATERLSGAMRACHSGEA